MRSKLLKPRKPNSNGGRTARHGDRRAARNRPEAATASSSAVREHHDKTLVGRAQPTSETKEMDWLVRHSTWLERYRGEWLLLQDDTVVAHDRDFRRIQRAIARRDIKSPFVYYVPGEREFNFVPA